MKMEEDDEERLVCAACGFESDTLTDLEAGFTLLNFTKGKFIS